MFKSFPWPSVTSEAGLPRDVHDDQERRTSQSPRIIFSPSPSWLVTIDGEPMYRPIPGTTLERIVNTQRLIVRDDAGVYHLRIPGGWMEAYTLTGMWSVSGMLPDWAATAPVRGARHQRHQRHRCGHRHQRRGPHGVCVDDAGDADRHGR